MFFVRKRKIDLEKGSVENYLTGELSIPSCHYAYVFECDGDPILASICEIKALGHKPLQESHKVIGLPDRTLLTNKYKG